MGDTQDPREDPFSEGPGPSGEGAPGPDREHDDALDREPDNPLEEDLEEYAASDDSEDDRDEDEEVESVTIEITGLSLYTHHGATAAEREVGQRLVLDLRLDLGQPDATVTDRLDDTVDYAEVCQLVALVAQQRSHNTLERLCATIAERLLGDYELEGIWVKATKPEPPIPLPVEAVSVEVWRESE